MKYSSFNPNKNDQLKEPMFFGNSVNVARYDQQKYKIFEKLIEKQLSFFWRPEEVDLTTDRKQFDNMAPHEQHIFLSNLQYQTLLDSVQGRSPNVAFLPAVSIPELETWFETWAFSETIHSRSYTHIVRNIKNDPSVVFDSIVDNPEIQKRAYAVTKYYDDFIEYNNYYNLFGTGTVKIEKDGETKSITITEEELCKKLYLNMASVNVLEAIRFYVSFACSFSFAERSLMEGNAKIIKLIARDEALHLTGTQHILNILKSGKEGELFKRIAKESEDEVVTIFEEGVLQEKDWTKYLFKDGSTIGLTEKVLSDYVEYITNVRMSALGLSPLFASKSNPIPWINNWLVSDNVQVAPQESEITSYLSGAVDSSVEEDEFGGFEL